MECLTRYLDMAKMLLGDSLKYYIQVDKTIDVYYKELAAFTPYFENCLPHAIHYKTDRSGKVDIAFTKQNEISYCTIKIIG